MRSSPGTRPCLRPALSRTLVAEGAPRGGLAALCITQTTGWGVLYYALIAAVRPISEDTGWDPALVTGAFSAGLLVSAAAGISVGRILDRTGPRTLMIGGSLVGMLALVMVATAPNLPVFFAAWLVAGTAQAAVLYQPAFTVISRWYGPARVRPLTVLTLVAGFASTIFAPLTAALTSAFGWRGAFIILAGSHGTDHRAAARPLPEPDLGARPPPALPRRTTG